MKQKILSFLSLLLTKYIIKYNTLLTPYEIKFVFNIHKGTSKGWFLNFNNLFYL